MTDRERLLMTVATAVFPGTQLNAAGPVDVNCARWETESRRPAEPGEIVWALSSGRGGAHDWSVARMVERLPHDGMRVRELGGERTCDITNELFYVLRGVRPELLLEGREWRVYEQIRLAFRLFDRVAGWNRYDCVLTGVRFEGVEVERLARRPAPRPKLTAVVKVRPHAFLSNRESTFEVRIDVSGRRPPSRRSVAEQVWEACPWHAAAS